MNENFQQVRNLQVCKVVASQYCKNNS